MQWFILRTKVGNEERVMLLFEKIFEDVKIIFPKRRLSWRKKGRIIDVIKPLFSGYLFVSASNERIKELNLWLRIKNLNAWFVKFDNSITCVAMEEMQLILRLMCNGDIVEKSEIAKIGEKVAVVRGPLVGMEGIVEKYSKRNRRVIINVTIGGKEKQVALEGTWISSLKD